MKDDLSAGGEGPDPVRTLLLESPQLVAVEVLTTPSMAAVVAARVR